MRWNLRVVLICFFLIISDFRAVFHMIVIPLQFFFWELFVHVLLLLICPQLHFNLVLVHSSCPEFDTCSRETALCVRLIVLDSGKCGFWIPPQDISHMMLGKALNLSHSQLPYLSHGDINSTCLPGWLWESNENVCKVLHKS